MGRGWIALTVCGSLVASFVWGPSSATRAGPIVIVEGEPGISLIEKAGPKEDTAPDSATENRGAALAVSKAGTVTPTRKNAKTVSEACWATKRSAS